MNIISKRDLQMLMESSRGPCASLFLPMHRLGAETRQNPIRLKNALREIEKRLPVYGLRSNEMQLFLDPLQDMVKDELFWQYQEDGLALFRSLDVFSYHCLPFSVQQEVIVSCHFHFKPLLRLLSDVERFYILALSQHGIRLFQATPYSTSEAALPDAVPRNLMEIARSDGAGKATPINRAIFPHQSNGLQISNDGIILDRLIVSRWMRSIVLRCVCHFFPLLLFTLLSASNVTL